MHRINRLIKKKKCNLKAIEQLYSVYRDVCVRRNVCNTWLIWLTYRLLWWKFTRKQCRLFSPLTEWFTEPAAESPSGRLTFKPTAFLFKHSHWLCNYNWCTFCVCFAADIISTVEFNYSGELLATGDKGGRVVIFQREQEVGFWS